MTDAALIFDIDSSRARTAATDLAKLQNAATKLAGEWSKTDNALRRTNGQFANSAEVVEKYGREVQQLAAKYNPALNAVYQFQQAEGELNRAVALGVLSMEQKGMVLDRIKGQLAAAANAQAKFGQSTDVARHHVANLSFQLNDIGMMMMSGQNPFMLMIQQGPQVAQIIGQMNQEGRKIGPTLAGAFKMFLNPTTAVTLALIAGAAALGQWAMGALGAAKDAEKFSDQLAKIDDAMNGVGQYTKFDKMTGKISLDVDAIIGKYGSLNNEVVRHIQLVNQASAAAANYAQLDFMAAFKETFDTGWLTTRVDEVRLAFGTTNDGARTLLRLMENISNAKGISAQKEAAIALRDEILRVSGGIDNMSKEQTAFLIQTNNVIESLTVTENQLRRNTAEIVQAAAETAQWENAMAGVLSYLNAIGRSLANISGTGISIAAARVEAEALKQGKSLRDAGLAAARETARLEGAQRTGELQKQYGLWGKILGTAETAAKQLEISEQASLDILRDQAREREKEANKKGKSGGGSAEKRAAAELKSAEKGFQSLRQLMEKESIFQFAEYDKRQTQLEEALAKRLISEQNYEKMRDQLRVMYFGSDFQIQALQYQMDQDALQAALDQKLITQEEYYRKLKEMQFANLISDVNRTDMAQDLANTAQYFGMLNSLTGSGFDGLLRLQKSFAAASALINAWKGYTDVLAQPGLPWWTKLAAAGKVLAAGLGAVSAIKGAGGGSGGGSTAATSAATPTAAQEPTREVLVRLDGTPWLVDLAEGVMQEIYQQSKDGRVIVARAN